MQAGTASGESPRPTRMREPAAWLAALGVCAAGAALIALFGRWLGVDSPIFAFEFHLVGMAVATYVDKLLAPRLDGARFAVSQREARLYRALGSLAFLRVQRAVGWERALRLGERRFELRRTTLRDYDHATRQGENAHAFLFLLTLAVAAGAALAGSPRAVPWLVGSGVLFHVYPVLLQRTQRARLQPLLARLERAHAA